MSSTRLQPLREPQVFGTAPRRLVQVPQLDLEAVRLQAYHSELDLEAVRLQAYHSLSVDNLQTVRSPQSQRRSSSTHSKSSVQATQIRSPGSVVSLTTLKPMPSATSVVAFSLSTPRLVQVSQLDLEAVRLQAYHSEYEKLSHIIQEMRGLEKELLVEDTDLQPLLANSDLTRMHKLAALLNYQVDALKLRVRDPKTQVMAASAAGGGVALGTAGAVTGAILGGAVGAGAGLPAALFTFGWSIPISAIVGGGAGLGLGASAGGAVGAIGGGTVGLQVYNYRTRVAALKESPAALKESPDLASLLDSALAGA